MKSKILHIVHKVIIISLLILAKLLVDLLRNKVLKKWGEKLN